MAKLSEVLASASKLAKQYNIPVEKAKWVIQEIRAGNFPKTVQGLSTAMRAYSKTTAGPAGQAGVMGTAAPKAAKPAVDKAAQAAEAFSTQRAQGYARGVARGVRAAPEAEGRVGRAFRGFGELFGKSSTPKGYQVLETNLSRYLNYVLKPEQAKQAIPLMRRRLPQFAEVMRLAGSKIPSGSLGPKEVLKQQTAIMETAVQGFLKEQNLLEEAALSKGGALRIKSLGKIAGSFSTTEAAAELAANAGKVGKAKLLTDATGLLKDTMVKGGTAAKVIGAGAGLLAAGKLAEAGRNWAAAPKIERELRSQIQTPDQILRDLKAQELMMLRDARLQGEMQDAAGGALQAFQPDRTLIPGAAYYSEQGGPNELDLNALMGG